MPRSTYDLWPYFYLLREAGRTYIELTLRHLRSESEVLLAVLLDRSDYVVCVCVCVRLTDMLCMRVGTTTFELAASSTTGTFLRMLRPLTRSFTATFTSKMFGHGRYGDEIIGDCRCCCHVVCNCVIGAVRID